MSAVIRFDCSRKEALVIRRIAGRAIAMAQRADIAYELRDCQMDLTAVHCNGTPLRLAELLAADDANFAHDVFGIRRFLDRDTGALTGCFVPRFAENQ
jgi:hypothetical protein